MDLLDIAGYIFGTGVMISLLLAAWVFPAAIVYVIWEWLRK